MGALELGRTIREARSRADLSLRDLNAASGVGLSHLVRLEKGRVDQPGPDTLRRLAGVDALGLDYTRLMREAGYL